MKSRLLLSTVPIAAMFAIAGCGDHHWPHGDKAQGSARHDDPQPVTVDIQSANEWKHLPHMRAYYDLTVATFVHGSEIDVDAYEAKSFALFREFARANGWSEQGMVDHAKLIPRQVVGIVKENPAVLKDYDTFWAALAGPD